MYYPKDLKHLRPPHNIVLDRKKNLKNSSLKELTNVLDEFCKESSFHGLSYVQDTSLPLVHRGFWLVIFLISLIAAIMTILNTYKDYHTDQIELSMEPMSSPIKDIPFPAVMICSSFPVRKSYFDLDTNGTNPNLRHYSQLLCPNDEELETEVYNSSLTVEFFDFINNASIPCENFLVNCRWNNIEEDCCDMFKPFISALGKCFVFNSYPEKEVYKSYTYPQGYNGPQDEVAQLWHLETGFPDRSSGQRVYPRWSEVPGANTGLTVTFLENRSEWQQACNGGSSGSSLVVFSPMENPEASNAIKLPFKLHTHIRLTPDLMYGGPDVQSVSMEERLCVYQGDVLLKYYKMYSQYNCLHECYINKTLEICGCAEFYYQGAIGKWNEPFCGGHKKTCVADVSFKILQISDGPNDTSKCHCLPLCTSLAFDLSSGFEKVEHSKQSRFASSSYNYSYGTIVSQVSVYYAKSEFVPLIRANAVSFSDSLSNCGGLLGLLFGFSFMSAFEIFYFIVLRPLVKLIKKHSS